MANESKKDFNAMLKDNKDMPKFMKITDELSIKRYDGDNMYFAPPIFYDKVMKKVPFGKLTTVVAWASYQREDDETPYWRILKNNGELNCKYPEGIELQKKNLRVKAKAISSFKKVELILDTM